LHDLLGRVDQTARRVDLDQEQRRALLVRALDRVDQILRRQRMHDPVEPRDMDRAALWRRHRSRQREEHREHRHGVGIVESSAFTPCGPL
jgi:hypothetical protein